MMNMDNDCLNVLDTLSTKEKEYALKILDKENQPIHNPQDLRANKRRRIGGNDSQPISTKQIITIGDIHGDFKILMVVLFKIIKSAPVKICLNSLWFLSSSKIISLKVIFDFAKHSV